MATHKELTFIHDIGKAPWFRQFLVYGVVGGVSTALDWGTFYMTNSQLGLHYIVCTFFSILIGSGSNFLLNRVVTFKNRSKRVGLQLIVYCMVSAASILLSLTWMYVFVSLIGLLPLIARITTTLIMYPLNFWGVRFFVFNPKTAWSQ